MVTLSVDTALDRDVTKVPESINITIQVFPLAGAVRTLSSVHTQVETIGTYRNTSMPGTCIIGIGTVSFSVQISVMTVLVDWRPLLVFSSGLKSSTINCPLLSCCSGGGQCD